MSTAVEALQRLRTNITRVIIGQDGAVDFMLTALLAGGHVLIEDVPGTGKTTLAQALARSIGADFKRIQLTPDLMPGDITGVAIYDEKERSFVLSKGPVFTNILLADELNRTTPRTQSALLQAMNEGEVTIDNRTHPLPRPFMVIATQNPVEFVGTYPLPEAQLDRFLMRISLGFPDREGEEQILRARRESDPLAGLTPVAGAAEIAAFQESVRRVRVDEALTAYIISLVRATREEGDFTGGVSTRGALALSRAAQAFAFLGGRDFVTPDDIKRLFVPVTCHRVCTEWDRLEAHARTAEVLDRILTRVPVPR